MRISLDAGWDYWRSASNYSLSSYSGATTGWLMSWTYRLGFALSLVLFLRLQATAQTTFQPNTDRRTAMDYEEFTMTRPTPQLCLDACLNSAPCRSWTFAHNPDGSATCEFGNQRRQAVTDPCCTSGTR